MEIRIDYDDSGDVFIIYLMDSHGNEVNSETCSRPGVTRAIDEYLMALKRGVQHDNRT